MIAKAPAKIVLHHLIVILPFAREVFFLEFYDPPAAVTLFKNRKPRPAVYHASHLFSLPGLA
jgi:hypothetical protein